MDCTSIVNEYLSFYNKYSKEYTRLALFMEVGKFYEIYGTETEGNTSEIGDILNIQISRKYKKIQQVSKANPYFWGFSSDNEISIKKYSDILLNANYTIVFIAQNGDLPNGKKSRGLYKILSNGTNTESVGVSNNLMCIYSDHNYGVSIIDITTGYNSVYEVRSFTELKMLIFEKNPTEFVINANSEELLKNELEIFQERTLSIIKISHQNEFLSRVFKDTQNSFLSPIEYLGLERLPLGVCSYILLLQFVLEHDSTILNSISMPVIHENELKLSLLNNCIEQFNLISKGNETSLLSIIDNTATAMGKRRLKDKLLNPITNTTKLKEYYSLIEKGNYEVNPLKGILDLERLHHKLNSGRFLISDFKSLDNSYSKIPFDSFYSLKDHTENYEEILLKFKSFIEDYNNTFDLENETFKENREPELDHLMNGISSIKQFFENTEKTFSKWISKNGENSVTFKTDKNDSYYLVTTKLRLETLKKNMPKDTFETLRISTVGNVVKIVTNEISSQSDKLFILNETLKKEKNRLFQKKINEYSTIYSAVLKVITDYISELDCLISVCLVAQKLNYTKPKICEGKSFINAKGLRHPIVEVLSKAEYIPNDITLDSLTNGVLLYGSNSCGKSTLLKSVGISVILAQAGMFVPADSFEFAPFTKIITRIGNLDNLIKGQSTFVVEMTELNTILCKSDKYTLILGDEVCSGTELISGSAIVASVIETLSKKKSKFIFSTHLHNLMKDPFELYKIKTLKCMHLSVEFIGNKLVYNRKLQNGNGPEIYGLEVAKAIITDSQFHKLANEIRNRIIPSISEIKESRYNSNLILTECEICGSKEDLHSHHIKFQRTFKGNNVLKHKESNLVPLCENCHTALHKNEIVINGWKETSVGKELDWYENCV